MIPNWKRRRLEFEEKLRELDSGYDCTPSAEGESEEEIQQIDDADIERFKL